MKAVPSRLEKYHTNVPFDIKAGEYITTEVWSEPHYIYEPVLVKQVYPYILETVRANGKIVYVPKNLIKSGATKRSTDSEIARYKSLAFERKLDEITEAGL